MEKSFKEIHIKINIIHFLLFLDRVMYARNQQYKYSKEPVTGGQPITVEQAKVS